MGLRSLPFFKAKKGWQFAGGGQSDGGGGGVSLPIATAETLGAVRVGSGLNVANDGTLSTISSVPLPTGYTLKLKEYTGITLSTSTWTQVDNADIIPLYASAVGFYGTDFYTGYANVRKTDNNDIYLDATTTQVQNLTDTHVYMYYLERSE